jgi:hypothetical protein
MTIITSLKFIETPEIIITAESGTRFPDIETAEQRILKLLTIRILDLHEELLADGFLD